MGKYSTGEVVEEGRGMERETGEGNGERNGGGRNRRRRKKGREGEEGKMQGL